MKRCIYNIVSILAFTSIILACSKEQESEAYGTLLFGDIEVTRAAQTDDYSIRIYSADGKLAGEWIYAQRPESVVLPVGDYKVCVASGEAADAEWEAPVYGIEKEFSIAHNQTTPLGTLTCTLTNVKLSVSFDSKSIEAMGDDCAVTATMGRGTLVFGKEETRAGYFKAVADGGTFDLTFAGTIGGSYETVNYSIENVRAGQWRQVNISVNFSVESDGKVVMTIDKWTTDSEIEAGE